MAISVTLTRRGRKWRGPELLLALVTTAAGAGALASVATLSPPLVLPVVSALLVFCAGFTALVAWRTRPPLEEEQLTYWDVTGLLTFVGICAALLSEPEQVVPLLDAQRR